jgi:hypothetical protein
VVFGKSEVWINGGYRKEITYIRQRARSSSSSSSAAQLRKKQLAGHKYERFWCAIDRLRDPQVPMAANGDMPWLNGAVPAARALSWMADGVRLDG